MLFSKENGFFSKTTYLFEKLLENNKQILFQIVYEM